MWEFNDSSRISILFNLKEVREANRAFSFVLNELSINYKLIKYELNINNALFEYVIL